MVALMFAANASALDIGKLLENKEGPDKFQIIHTADLAKLMADPKSGVWIGDANPPGVRDRYGIIPGAHQLSSDDKYDVNAELPTDKNAKLVFYCTDFK
jgi:rhodanese-related sulfurtransferase